MTDDKTDDTEISHICQPRHERNNEEWLLLGGGVKGVFFFFLYIFFLLIQMFYNKHTIVFIIKPPKFKALKEQLKIQVTNGLSFFLLRNSAPHRLKGKVQTYRVTSTQVHCLRLHPSVSATHKALSIMAQTSNTKWPQTPWKKRLHFSVAMLRNLLSDRDNTYSICQGNFAMTNWWS